MTFIYIRSRLREITFRLANLGLFSFRIELRMRKARDTYEPNEAPQKLLCEKVLCSSFILLMFYIL